MGHNARCGRCCATDCANVTRIEGLAHAPPHCTAAGARARFVFTPARLALLRLRERLRRSRRFDLELHFQGSLDCLAALHHGQCDVAGFHVPNTAAQGALLEQFRPSLRERTLRLLHLVNRQQGLLVARGNPLRLETLNDLVRTRASFVNRQPGSGTRLCFDHLLAANRIRPRQINGYQNEEFTHAAVAATVAKRSPRSGSHRGSSSEQHLDFVPVIMERYFSQRSCDLGPPGRPRCLSPCAWRNEGGAGRSPGYSLPQALHRATIHETFDEGEVPWPDRSPRRPGERRCATICRSRMQPPFAGEDGSP